MSVVRLIDADALKNNMFDYAPPEMTWDRGDIEHKIDEMPTIDAIPVAWLDDKFLDYENEDLALSRAAWLIMHAWQKEQEVGHG